MSKAITAKLKSGAISSTAELFSGKIKSNSTLSEVIFDCNSVKSFKRKVFGGAFYYGYIQCNSDIEQTIASLYLFDNSFINNKTCTNSSNSYGGAISYFPQFRI